MTSPFDPTSRIAAFLHPSVCPEHATDVAGADCPVALEAAARWRSDLFDAGLATLPLEVIQFVERQFTLAIGDDGRDGDGDGGADRILRGGTRSAGATPDEQREADDVGGAPPAVTADLYRAPTLLVYRRWDGSEERMGPWARPLAEAMLVDFNWSHDAGIVAARLEPEATWIGHLLDGLNL